MGPGAPGGAEPLPRPFLRYVSCARPHRLWGLAFRCLWAAAGSSGPGGRRRLAGPGAPAPAPPNKKRGAEAKPPLRTFQGALRPAAAPPGPLEPANGATGPPRRKSKYPAKQQRRKPSSARLPQGLTPGSGLKVAKKRTPRRKSSDIRFPDPDRAAKAAGRTPERGNHG